MKTFFLFIAILATVAAILTLLFLDRAEWAPNLKKSVGAAVLNFGFYFFLRYAEKKGKEREKLKLGEGRAR